MARKSSGPRKGEKVYDNDTTDIEPPVRGHIPRDFNEEPYGTFAAAFPPELLVSRSDWSARIKELREKKELLSDFWLREGLKALHQGNTSMCWTFNVVSGIMAVRAKMGLPYVALSPASAAAPCMNFQDNGGWSTRACKWIAEHGISTVALWGSQTANKRSLWTEEVKADALTRRIQEFTDVRPRNEEQQMSLAINQLPGSYGYNFMGHAVCALDPVEVEPGSFGLRLIDNYGQNHDGNGMYILRFPKALCDDGVALRVISATVK